MERKLPVFATAKLSYRCAAEVIAQGTTFFIVMAVVLFVVDVVSRIVVPLVVQNVGLEGPLVEAALISLGILFLIVPAVLDVVVIRHVLLGERPSEQAWAGRPVWRLFLLLAGISLVILALTFIPLTTTAGMAAAAIALLVVCWAAVRICLVGAAIAVESKMTPMAVVRLTRGKVWPLVGLFFLVAIGPGMLLTVVNAATALLPVLSPLGLVVYPFIKALGLILTAAAAANAFRALTDVPATSEAAPGSQAPQLA